jgi:hypothetical protein
MANGTLKVGTITTSSGSGTITIPNAVTVAGAMASTPAFRAYASSAQAPSASSITKAQLDTENYDTDSCYDTSTYRFTPTVAGKYVFNFLVTDNYTTTAATDVVIYIYKNGSSIGQYANSTKGSNYGGNFVSTTVEMNGSTDYIEFYLYHQGGSGVKYRNSSDRQYAEGYRLIGV